MKKSIIVCISAIAITVAFAENTSLGYRALNLTENISSTTAIGEDTVSSGKEVNRSIAIGGNALMGAANVSECVAIGNGAMAGAHDMIGSVAIGSHALQGLALSDTTVINENQIMVSKPMNAFCINPNKERNITDTPLYYLNGVLHLNADEVDIKDVFQGKIQHFFREAVFDLGSGEGTLALPSDKLFHYIYTNLTIRIEQVSGNLKKIKSSGKWHTEILYNGNVDFEKDYEINNEWFGNEVTDEGSFSSQILYDGNYQYEDYDDRFYSSFEAVREAETDNYSIWLTIAKFRPSISSEVTDTKYFSDVPLKRFENISVYRMYDDVSPYATNAFVSAIGMYDFLTNVTEIVTNNVLELDSTTNRISKLESEKVRFDEWLSTIDYSVKTSAVSSVSAYTSFYGYFQLAKNIKIISEDTKQFIKQYEGVYCPRKVRIIFDYTDNNTDKHIDVVQDMSNWSNLTYTAVIRSTEGYTQNLTITVTPDLLPTDWEILDYVGINFSSSISTTKMSVNANAKDNILRRVRRNAEGCIDNVVSANCLSSTQNVFESLGGMTFKMEGGQFCVYTNGVKIGTLTFTPTPAQ